MNDVKAVITGVQAELSKTSSVSEIKEVLKRMSASLENEADIKYGCHCDLEYDQKPDGCVLDEGKPYNCIYACDNIKTKWDCKYWKVILNP